MSFVATKVCLSRQKFVTTNTCDKVLSWPKKIVRILLSRQKTCLSRQNWYLWQLPPLIADSLHCFLVGVNKSFVIATSCDLWLFIHTSNLQPSLLASLQLYGVYGTEPAPPRASQFDVAPARRQQPNSAVSTPLTSRRRWILKNAAWNYLERLEREREGGRERKRGYSHSFQITNEKAFACIW